MRVRRRGDGVRSSQGRVIDFRAIGGVRLSECWAGWDGCSVAAGFMLGSRRLRIGWCVSWEKEVPFTADMQKAKGMKGTTG